MVDDLQDGSEVVDFQEDTLTWDRLFNKRNKIASKFGSILVFSLTVSRAQRPTKKCGKHETINKM